MPKKKPEDNTWIIPVAPGTAVVIRPPGKKQVRLEHLLDTPLVPIQVEDEQIRNAAVRSGVYRFATTAEINSVTKETSDEL